MTDILPRIPEFTAAFLAQSIREKTPIAFTRWGDGEWVAALQLQPGKSNCDGHSYFPDMGKALQKVLRSRPKYYLGVQSYALQTLEPAITDWLRNNGLQSLRWADADILHRAAIANDWTFLDAIKAHRHLVVGPEHLRTVFPAAIFVPVPSVDCWTATDRVIATVRRKIKSTSAYTTAIFCASMPANVWIDTLWPSCGRRASLIDAGSVFDPLGGVYSRKYMRRAQSAPASS